MRFPQENPAEDEKRRRFVLSWWLAVGEQGARPEERNAVEVTAAVVAVAVVAGGGNRDSII